MKKDKNLDELFRDKLLNYEQEPPAYLLENILSGVADAVGKENCFLESGRSCCCLGACICCRLAVE